MSKLPINMADLLARITTLEKSAANNVGRQYRHGNHLDALEGARPTRHRLSEQIKALEVANNILEGRIEALEQRPSPEYSADRIENRLDTLNRAIIQAADNAGERLDAIENAQQLMAVELETRASGLEKSRNAQRESVAALEARALRPSDGRIDSLEILVQEHHREQECALTRLFNVEVRQGRETWTPSDPPVVPESRYPSDYAQIMDLRRKLAIATEPKAEKDTAELREKLADHEHRRWAHWQAWMHSRGSINAITGDMTIPAALVRRWTRQIDTNYENLTEKEKDTDRMQVIAYLPLIEEFYS